MNIEKNAVVKEVIEKINAQQALKSPAMLILAEQSRITSSDLFLKEIDADYDHTEIAEAIIENVDLCLEVPEQSATDPLFEEAFTASDLGLMASEFNTFIYAWNNIQAEIMLLEMQEAEDDDY